MPDYDFDIFEWFQHVQIWSLHHVHDQVQHSYYLSLNHFLTLFSDPKTLLLHMLSCVLHCCLIQWLCHSCIYDENVHKNFFFSKGAQIETSIFQKRKGFTSPNLSSHVVKHFIKHYNYQWKVYMLVIHSILQSFQDRKRNQPTSTTPYLKSRNWNRCPR